MQNEEKQTFDDAPKTVWLDKYQIPVYTDLKRADEILYATDTQLLKRPKTNYFALADLGETMEETAKKSLAERAGDALMNKIIPGRYALMAAAKTQFGRGFLGASAAAARQLAAGTLKDLGTVAVALGQDIDTRLNRDAQIDRDWAQRPNSLRWQEKVMQNYKAAFSMLGPVDINRVQERLGAWEREQKKIDEFNQKVKNITALVTKRAGLDKTEKDGFVYDFGAGASSFLFSVGALAVTRNPALVAPLFGVMEGQGSYETALEAGLDPVKAYGVGKANSAWITATEMVGEGLLNKLLFTKGVLGRAASRVLKRAKDKSPTRQITLAGAIGAAQGGGIEGTQEALQNIGSDVIMNLGGAQEKKVMDILQDALYAGLLAFPLGGAAGAAGGSYHYAQYAQNVKQRLLQTGMPEQVAEQLAHETALEAVSAELTDDTISAVSGEINSPLSAQDRNPQALAEAAKNTQKRDFAKEYDEIEARAKNKFKEAGLSDEEASLGAAVEKNIVSMQAAHLGLTPELAEKSLEISFNQELSEQDAKIRFIGEMETMTQEEQEAFYKTSKMTSYKEMLGELAAFRAGLNEETAPILDSGSTAGMTTEGASGSGGAQRAPMTTEEFAQKENQTTPPLNKRTLTTRAGGPAAAGKNVSIIPVKADKAVPHFDKTAQLRDYIFNVLNVLGNVEIKATKTTIHFGRQQIRRGLKRGRSDTHNQFFADVKNAVANAQYAGFEIADSEHPDVVGQDVYYTALRIGTNVYAVELKADVLLDQKGNSFDYAGHKVQKMEDGKRPGSSPVLQPSSTISINQFDEIFKRAPTSAHLSTLTQGPYTNNIGNKEGKVKGKTYNQDTITFEQSAAMYKKPEFKAWFGKSKLVDDAGNPLVVYHGTNQTFNEFKINPLSKWLGKLGEGIYFTDNPQTAQGYGEDIATDNKPAQVYPVYLRLENPLVLKDFLSPMPKDMSGYDGVICGPEGNREIVVFSPEQIKSVNNRGAWNTQTTNIYEQGENPTLSKEKGSNIWDTQNPIPEVEAALAKIASGSEEETVLGLRPDFVKYGGTPDVTFIWGNEKKGLQHIALEHGPEILPQVIDTVVSGEIVRFTAAKKTLTLRKGKIEAVLSLDENGKQKTWLLTGWDTSSEKGKKKRTGANGQVSTGSAATQIPPTFSRRDLGAVLGNSITKNNDIFKGETYQQSQRGQTALMLDSGSTAGMTTEGDPGSGGAQRPRMTAGGVRGKTAITSKDGFIRAVITAGQAADKSTFVHEMAHIYLSAFQHVYGMEEYTAQRKHLDAWLGKPRGGVYSRAQQEKFAEGFEQFLKEGHAPVPYLRSIFEKFRAWIIRVYDGADVSKLSDAAREAYADMFRSEAADAQHTVEFCQNAKKDYGRIRATLEKIKQNKIDVKDLDGVDVEALRDFIGILKKPAPALPKRHLLTDLRRYGAQYANSGRIDKEAYKNARVYDKQTGVGDKPADWLVKHGYMEDAEVNTYEEAQAREEEACGLIERALSGEPVYRLEDRARVELHNAYREAVNMAEDAIGADYKNYEKLLESIDALVKQGYRVVEKSDLAFMEEKFEELANLRESEAFLAQEESFGRVDDARRGSADERRKEKVQKARLENLRKAQSLKKAVLAELGKRRLFATPNTESGKTALMLDSGSMPGMTAEGGKLKNELPPNAPIVAHIQTKKYDFSGTLKEIKTKLVQWYKDNLQGTSAVNPELGDVAFTRAGISEVKGKALTQKRAYLLTAAKSVIEKGTVVGEHTEENHPQGIKKFHFVQGKVELDGVPVIMQVDVAEDAFGKKFYYVSEIQSTEGLAHDQNTGSLGDTNSITQNSDIVKAQNPLAEVQQELEKAKTVEDIYKGIDHALAVIEDAYGNSEAGKAEAGRMAPPAQDWDARRVELLKELSEINQKTDDNAAWAFAAIERDGLIVPHKNGITPAGWNVPAAVSEKQRKMNVWKAEQILDEQLRNRYYKAFEKALGKIEGLKAPQKSIILREFNNIRYRNKNVPELIVKTLESARQYVEKNYKAYMAGKIADMIKTPLFEKSGSLRTAKYSPAAQEFLKAAHRIVTLDEQTAQDSYAHAVQNQNYDEALTKAQVLQNRLLQLRAAPETMTAAEVRELYNDVNELRKAGRDEVRLEKFLRNTREDIMREWLITALAKQKTVLGAVTYVKKLANWQSILNTLFGELEVPSEVNGQMGKKKIKFMDELSLEQNQIQMQNHVRELRRRVVERFGEAYGIKNGNEYIKKINELQSETYTLDNYGEIPEGPQELLTERQRKPFKQTITKLELMFFYIQDQNPLNRARLQRAYREEQYASLFAPLSAADKKACAALMEIAQSTYGQMNEVHKRERGFTLGRVENYFPNRTERLTGGLDYLREMLASNAAPSAIKARVQTVLAVEKPVNPVSLLMGEISRNAEYIYGAESAGKLRRIFRDKQMARALEEKFGKQDGRDIYEHIIKMIDLNGPGARIAEKSQFFETMEFLFNNWVKSAIGLKPIVAIKQFASAFNYAENMPVAAWISGFKDALAHPRETLRFMQEFSPYLVTRYEEGGMNETLGRALSKDDTFGVADKINTLTNAITVNVRLGDKFALAFGGKPYVDWLMKEKGYTKEAARAAFELATVRSQQANLKSTLNEAQLNGGNLFWRAAWAFRNQQMQYARKLFDAYSDWKNGYISDGDMAKKVFMYAIVQPALYTLLSLGWFARDDDDRKDDWWRLAASPVEQTLGAVPFGDDLTDLLFANLRSLCADGKLSGMRSYELPGIVDMTHSFNKFVKNFNAGDASLNDWLDTLAEIGQFSGFGTKQIKTQLGGVKDALTGKPVKGGMKIIGYTDNRAKKVTGEKERTRKKKK